MTSSIPTSSDSVPFKRPPPRVVEVRRLTRLTPALSELRAFQARRQADSEAGRGLGDQLRHQG